MASVSAVLDSSGLVGLLVATFFSLGSSTNTEKVPDAGMLPNVFVFFLEYAFSS